MLFPVFSFGNHRMTLDTASTPEETSAFEKALDIYATAFDSILSSNALETFPVIGAIIGLGKAGLAVHHVLFVKKIERFLTDIKSVTHKEKEEFIKKLEEDPSYKQLVVENLLLLIDRIDDMEKTVFVADLFKAHMRGSINYDTYRRFASIIDKTLVTDLKAFLNTSGQLIVTDLEMTETSIHSLDLSGITTGLASNNYKEDNKELADIRLVNPDYKDGTYLIASYFTNVGREMRVLLKRKD